MKRDTRLDRKLVITMTEREVKAIVGEADLKDIKYSELDEPTKDLFKMLYLFNEETKRRHGQND